MPRQTMIGLARDVVGRTLGIEQGFLHTVAQLTVAPGRVVQEYLAGRTRPYTHPLAYLVIAFGTFALIGDMVGDGTTLLSGNNAALTGLVVLFVAAVSRALDRHGYNYAEHLILAMYLFGHMALGIGIAPLITPIASSGVMRLVGLSVTAAAVVYFIWGYASTIGRGRLVGPLRAAVSLIGGIALWTVCIFLVIRSLST